MTEENQDQSFEDAFNELADAPSSEIEDDLPEEEFEDEQLQEGQEEEGLREVGSDDESEVEDDSVEAQLQRAREEAQLWQHKYNSDLGRQNAFQRKLAEQQQYIDQLQNQMKRSSPESMTPNEWKAIQEDYPEIAQGFQAYVGELEQRHRAEIESVRSALQPIQQQAEESYVMDQFRLLENEHPDYREIAQSDSFKAWMQQQPANVRDMYESKQAADAAYLLRSYKNDLMPGVQASSELKQRREKQLRQAQTVPQRGGRTRSNMPPEDDFEAAFDYFASKQ